MYSVNGFLRFLESSLQSAQCPVSGTTGAQQASPTCHADGGGDKGGKDDECGHNCEDNDDDTNDDDCNDNEADGKYIF